jgi:glycosyltransferase involved in cell wall biosynthesis
MISELNILQASNQNVDFRQNVKYQSVNRADHVICISEHTRQDLLQLFDVPENKVSVVHLGCSQLDGRQIATQSIEDHSEKYYSRPFLLYVGMRDGYKNFEQMLRAIAASSSIQKTFDLIAFGGGTFNETEQALLVTLGYRSGQVKQVNGSDQVLNALYQQAAALIYPSTYEGFGLPPLEAMAMQCPVVSSETSSMPEVIGDAAEYFDPHQVDSMRCAIERVVFSEEKTRALIEKGNARVKQFTWEQCAEKTLKIYRTLSPDSNVNH